MASRTINATISSNYNTDLEPGMSVKFGVTSDSGPVSNMKATGGSLYLSRVKIYSSAFYLTVKPSSGGSADTETLTANSGETGSTTLSLDDVDDGLLTGSPSSITLTVTKVSGDKTKMNFREGCTLTLTINYSADDGGEGGGDSGGDSGGGGHIVPSIITVSDLAISATKSLGEAATVTWKVSSTGPKTPTVHLLVDYSEDGVNWIETVYQYVCGQGDAYGTTEFSRTVYPPDVPWAYHRYGVSTDGLIDVESDYVYLQYVRPELNPYTDPTIYPGRTPIKAVHILDIVNNLRIVFESKGLYLPSYKLTGEWGRYDAGTPVKYWNFHVETLRSFVDDYLTTDHEEWLPLSAEIRPRADVMMQLRRVVAEVNNKL